MAAKPEPGGVGQDPSTEQEGLSPLLPPSSQGELLI